VTRPGLPKERRAVLFRARAWWRGSDTCAGVGASGELGNSKVIGFVSVNATASKNDGNYQAITVGVRVPL